MLARRYVAKRRAGMAAFEREQKMLEEFEQQLDSIHEHHMNDLLAIRVQSGVREMLAKS